MARRTATPAFSPKMLKHFAAATVVLTGLLAFIASGDEWGAQAQVQAIEAKNQLAATEAEKLGTKKVATTLKVANNTGGGSFGTDEGGNFGNVAGGGGGYAPPAPPLPQNGAVAPGPRKTKSPWGTPNEPSRPPQPPGFEQDPAQSEPDTPPAPSAQDLARMNASSARRSGSNGSGD